MEGKYRYTEDLLALQACKPEIPLVIPSNLAIIQSPLSEKLGEWRRALEGHPDKLFSQYILVGLAKGFRVGFDYTQQCKPAVRNLTSAQENPTVVREYLQKECGLGRVAGPFEKGSIHNLQVSPFGVIPKQHTPGQWRLIMDLSHPPGRSVNDGIQSCLSSLSYVSVDNLSETIVKLGRESQLAKMDIKSAYRVIPVYPEDRLLLGLEWEGKVFVEMVLPFGLRSAPKIFNAVADALQWVMISKGIKAVFHYLDDFITVGAPRSDECRRANHIMLTTCEQLGVPIAHEKCEGPTSCLSFLGIEVDTASMQLRLPGEKLNRLNELVSKWVGRRSITKKELESLAGHLQHACKVVPAGRCFMRRIFELISVADNPAQKARLNIAVRSDLKWWQLFLQGWNGVSLLWNRKRLHPDMNVWSDASGSWGCGALSQSQWLQHQWLPHSDHLSIAVKELVPVVLAAATWGHTWKGKIICFNSDNEAVVADLKSRYSRDPTMAHLLRCLCLYAARYTFWFWAAHIPGRLNSAADALSRNKMSCFYASAPQEMDREAVPLMEGLPGLLYQHQETWMSPAWTRQFSATLTRH